MFFYIQDLFHPIFYDKRDDFDFDIIVNFLFFFFFFLDDDVPFLPLTGFTFIKLFVFLECLVM